MKKATLWHNGQEDIIRFYNWMIHHNLTSMIKVKSSTYSPQFMLDLAFTDNKAYTLFLLNFKRTATKYRPKRFLFQDCEQ